MIIVHGIYKEYQSINQINNAILRSPHHIHAHFETRICKKKNINIQRAQINQLNIDISVKFTQDTSLNINKPIIESTTIATSYISLSHFIIIT